jgi:hypothetical protein
MSFDIANYTANAHRVVDDDVYYTAFERNPLPDAALRALQYMSDVESHTICYLTKVVCRIQQQETRHAAFYASQARKRLERSRTARLLTRLTLRMAWIPVGSGIMPAAETAFLLRYLMGGAQGTRMIRQIDEKIDWLPGLAGMNLVSRAAARCGVGPDAVGSGTGSVQRVGSRLGSLLRSPLLSR